MPYVRKTEANILYYDGPKGRLERINNITWMTVLCAQCKIQFTRKIGIKKFQENERFYCSALCLNESQRHGIAKKIKEKHFLKKYNTKNPFSSKEIREKIKSNLLEEYGVENVSQIQEIRDKKSELMKKTCNETDFLERVSNTMKQNYGCHWLATEDAREKLRQYSFEKYGVDHLMKSQEFRNNVFKLSFLEKYCVDNPMKIKEIVQKVRQTCLEKYGVDNVFKREDVIENRTKTLLKNCKNKSSKEEDNVYQILIENFGKDLVQRHIPVFYRKTNFWIIDFQIGNIFIQYDGEFWHGLSKQKKELQKLISQGDKVAKMQYKTLCKDKFQDIWFKKNNLLIFRIFGTKENTQEKWLPLLKQIIAEFNF